MSNKKVIYASQISTDISSWYQRLRRIQGDTDKSFLSSTKIAQSTDPNITQGSVLKAVDMNTFLQSLNNLQSNEFLKEADWTSKLDSVTSNQIAQLQNFNDVNTLLTSLEAICSNYGTKSTYSYTETPETCYNC